MKKYYKTSNSEANIHKSLKNKNINLSLSKLKYAGGDHDCITEYQLKKPVNLKILSQYHEIKREEEPNKMS